jgi:hypothetical protein
MSHDQAPPLSVGHKTFREEAKMPLNYPDLAFVAAGESPNPPRALSGRVQTFQNYARTCDE